MRRAIGKLESSESIGQPLSARLQQIMADIAHQIEPPMVPSDIRCVAEIALPQRRDLTDGPSCDARTLSSFSSSSLLSA